MPTEPQNDENVMSLLEQALAQPAGQRESFLRGACSQDRHLFEQVWNYVQWEERMDGFLLNPLYPLPDNEHPFESGQVLDNRFRIVREVAQGGMGVVYEAIDCKLNRRIAIKCAKSGFHKRLPPEVRNASEVSHPNVCKTYEIHTASTDRGDVDFLTMEFLEGQTLADRLREGPMPLEEARTIAHQLCLGLAEAHRNQVIHGDLKSNNIILTITLDGLRSVITDFGLARCPASQQPGVQSGELGGAPDYMAPELLKGEKPSVASDIYALGVILYEMASGQRPFGEDASWEARLNSRPVPLKHCWRQIVARCLEPEPSRRYARINHVAKALAPAASRRWWGIAAAGILAVIGGVAEYSKLSAPPESVRLAVLPFEADANAAPVSEGLLLDTSDRLSHLKAGRTRRITLIPLADALQNKVDQPVKARTMLGATHTLNGALSKENGRVVVVAYLTDTSSLVHLREWRGEYSTGELRNMPTALAGMVTATLRLPPLAVAATVNAAAYPDYSAGVALARRDPEVDRALPLLERAVMADPNSPLTHAKLAEAQWVKYQLTQDLQWQERALASLKNAEQRNPDVAAVRLLSGLIHESFGQYEQAQEDLFRAIELEPNNGDAWRQLGKVYEDNDQPNQALAAYLKAIEVQPDYFKNYQRLGSFYFNRGEYEDAVRQLKRMVELVPDLADAHYALAAPYLNMGRYRDADYELNLAISYQETARAVMGLGLSCLYQGRNSEAIPHFQRAIKIGPPTSLYYINLGTAWRRANFPREAQEAYSKGLDLAEATLAQNPKDAFEKSCLAYLSAQLGDHRRANSEAAQALQISSKAINVRWMAIQTYELLGKRNLTLTLLQDAPVSMFVLVQRSSDLADLQADSRFQQLLVSHHIP